MRRQMMSEARAQASDFLATNERLRREVVARLARAERLEEENARLREQVEYWRAEHDRVVALWRREM